MAEKIKALRQKQSETLYGPEIPIGADLINVEVSQSLVDAFYALAGEEKPSSPALDAEFYLDKLIEITQNLKTENVGKAPEYHASAQTTYGVGSETEYGHVKLASSLDSVVEGAAYSQSAMVAFNQELIKKNEELTEQLNSIAGTRSIVAAATTEGKPEGVDVSTLTAGSLWFIQK